jgi:hypothetical protein
MKEEMEELYTEGVATRGGPEPCDDARKDAAEALARGTCRQAIEPRNKPGSGCRHRSPEWKATSPTAVARAAGGPRGVEEPCMHGTFMRENREIPPLPAACQDGRRAAQGRLRPQA